MAIVAYLITAILAAALTVRFFPRLSTSHRLRKSVAWIPFFPFMLAAEITQTLLIKVGAVVKHVTERLFETLSGRSMYSPTVHYYGSAYTGKDKRKSRKKGRPPVVLANDLDDTSFDAASRSGAR